MSDKVTERLDSLAEHCAADEDGVDDGDGDGEGCRVQSLLIWKEVTSIECYGEIECISFLC